ncbi:MAG: glutathione S-transferase family protein [Alphaproteobacteria bacterium]|nr:glutathione S-transferase family protein [Alphaproteobacteria bacterium]
MELFTARVCPYAHRTRLALLEKGVPFEHIEEDLRNKSERFMKASPYGKVPALVHNGQTLYESLIINEYLDETFPEPPLMPADPALRARARIWIHYFDTYFNADFYAVIQNKDAAKDEELKAKINERFLVAEQQGFGELSGEGPYWLGSKVSLVDLAWYPYFERLPAWAHYRNFKIPDNCPKIAAWAEAMAGRASVQEAANDPAYYIEGYARYAA